MQSLLPFNPRPPAVTDGEWLQVGGRQLRLQLVPNRRARRYVLRLWDDGIARVTIPRGGSLAGARRFADTSLPWLERQLVKQAARPHARRAWLLGAEILFRGSMVRLEAGPNGETGLVRFGAEAMRVKSLENDLRPEIEAHLREVASRELPARVLELATRHHLPVRRVAVRNQRSRWGSCSRCGTISLNWRLVQAPDFVRDYIVLHELAHLSEMNHSTRFWAEVRRLCPDFADAERWLKRHADLLR